MVGVNEGKKKEQSGGLDIKTHKVSGKHL